MSTSLPYRESNTPSEAPGEDDEDEEIDETGYKTMKDAVLFAIDVSPSMLQVLSNGEDARKAEQDSATSAALKCAYQLMQQRIITNPKDMMGILLFGTEESKFEDGTGSAYQYPHCYLLVDLDRPEAGDVKRLRNLVEDDEEAAKLLIPSEEPVAMSNLLFCANQIFTTKAANFSSRRLFLVTDNDDPHPSKKDQRSAAAVRAKDLSDLGVTIELFPISRPGHDFDRTIFYDDIIYRTDTLDPEAPAHAAHIADTSSGKDGLTLLQALVSSVMSRSAMRRALFANMPLEVSPNLTITVKGYIIFKRQSPAKSCWCFTAGEQPQIVESSMVRSAVDSGRTISQPEIRVAYKFGGEAITFSPEEIAQIKDFGSPVIRIIGFKSLDLLPLWATMKESIFLYPSEEGVVGSTRTFSALYQSLLRKKKMALCWHIARKRAAPNLCALIPGRQLGPKAENPAADEPSIPEGLWLVKLPFADDIRQLPERVTHIVAPNRLADAMRVMIQQLQLPKAQYNPFKFPNPSLQWHYRVLQAIALDEDVPEKAADATVPRYRQIRKRIGAYALEWASTLDEELLRWQGEQSGRGDGSKRPAPSSNEPTAKKVKVEGGSNIGEADMRNRFKKQTIGQLTVAVLKDFIKETGIKVTAGSKKQDLIEAVEKHFENKMQVD